MSWDTAALQTEITKAVEEYRALLATERVTVEVDLITAVMRLDGVLIEVVVDPRAMREEPDELADMLTDAIASAEDAVARRRDAVGRTVTFLGHPVLEMVELMMKDPVAASSRLAGDPESRRQAWAS
jgi:DNA-binding protein YbaB